MGLSLRSGPTSNRIFDIWLPFPHADDVIQQNTSKASDWSQKLSGFLVIMTESANRITAARKRSQRERERERSCHLLLFSVAVLQLNFTDRQFNWFQGIGCEEESWPWSFSMIEDCFFLPTIHANMQSVSACVRVCVCWRVEMEVNRYRLSHFIVCLVAD